MLIRFSDFQRLIGMDKMAWNLGCLIWQIFNPEDDSRNYSEMKNFPSQLQKFYKKRLSKNYEKRPGIDALQHFLVSSIRLVCY